jgi:hypothetical protein
LLLYIYFPLIYSLFVPPFLLISSFPLPPQFLTSLYFFTNYYLHVCCTK